MYRMHVLQILAINITYFTTASLQSNINMKGMTFRILLLPFHIFLLIYPLVTV